MSKRRDFISDILDRRSRHPKRTDRRLQLMKRVEGLLLSLHHVCNRAPKKHSRQAELLRYFPIGIVVPLRVTSAWSIATLSTLVTPISATPPLLRISASAMKRFMPSTAVR